VLILLLFFLFQFFLLGIFCGGLEIPDRLTHPCPDLRQLAGAENDQNDHKDNDQLRHSDSKHKSLLLFVDGIQLDFPDQSGKLLRSDIAVQRAFVIDPAPPGFQPDLIVPVEIGIALSLEPVDEVDVFLQAAVAEKIGGSEAAGIGLPIGPGFRDLAAAFFAPVGPAGRALLFLNRPADFSSASCRRLSNEMMSATVILGELG
jgi:hypothetical protein